MLNVCYDLAVSPPTYDFVAFLLWAEAERVRRGEDKIGIHFSPGPADGFRRDNLWPRSVTERGNVFTRVVWPMAALLPNCNSVGFMQGMVPGLIGKGQVHYGFDVYVREMAKAGRPLRAASSVNDPALVTITLRECEHWPERNSNLAEWLKAAAVIADMGYKVVFVRDTLRHGETLDLFPINVEASCHLSVRASLYQSALCNLFVSNGPAWLAIAMNAPVLMLKPTTESLGRCYTSEYFASCGLPKGGQLPMTPAHQRIVWQDDRAENIAAAFEEFAAAAAPELLEAV